MPKYYYHFVGDTLRDGRPVPKDGEWLEHEGHLILCSAGLHASEHPFDALKYAPGNTLCLVELGGEDLIRGGDKVCARKRKIIARFDATSLLRRFAADQALSVRHLWKMPDVVKDYLETLDESKRKSARDATAHACSYINYDVSYADAAYATYAATCDSACEAARHSSTAECVALHVTGTATDSYDSTVYSVYAAAANNEFKKRVDAIFKEILESI